MKKNYRFLSLLLAIPLLLSGCGGNKPSSSSSESDTGTSESSGGGGSTSSTETEAKVTSVSITKPSDTVVLDGTRVSLKATVKGDEGVSQKVTWSTSNDKAATVTNGVVNFLKVSEETKVTITATSVADAQFKDSVEFTIEHSPFDLKNSRGNPDTSLFLDEGSFIIEDPQDIALVYADVHDTRWYVEATIQVDSFLETDPYPKFGFMASERDDGMWTYEQSHQFFYYVDTVAAAKSWTAMNVVTEDNDLVNWDWSAQISPATASPAVKLGEPFKMGLMRDGNKFYQFYGKASALTLDVVGSFEYNSFGTEANYVWVGGWATAATVSDPKCMVGNEIDSLYSVPAGLELNSAEETVYLGNSFKLEVHAEGLWNRNKLTFASDDETIATVDANGVVTAKEKVGTANITVGLEGTELSAKFVFNVTDDKLFKVVLDGEMNDAIWSETVKTNSYLLKKNNDYYVQIYGAKNSRGLYLFMEYNVKELAVCNPNEWWTWENVEFRLANDAKAWSGQYWVSSMNGGRFVSVGSGEKAEEVFYKALVQGEDGLFHGAFEMFVPYGDDCVTKDQATYFCAGFAPKSGWYNGYNWYAGIGAGTLNITANGFAHDDGTFCSEAHAYGQWIVDVAATCKDAGSAHRTCAYCGHTETKVLDIDPNAHAFDYEHAEVTTVPDCMHTGIGTATCTLCGAVDETVLPKDYTNHTDKDYPATHNHCHDCGIGSYLTNAEGDLYDRGTVGGPWDKNGWYDVGLFEGDFTFVFEMHMQGGCGGNADDWGSYCWRTVLPFVYQEGYNGDQMGHFFRMDWCGFGGDAFLKDINNGENVAGLYPSAWDVFNNSDIVLTYKKVGANISLNWKITCKATTGDWAGVVIDNYNQSCVLKDATAKVGIALASEFAICNITKAALTRA